MLKRCGTEAQQESSELEIEDGNGMRDRAGGYGGSWAGLVVWTEEEKSFQGPF
jgi:hypothetical protein